MPIDSQSGAISSAVAWVAGLLVGPLATAIAIIAVAVFGLMMLRGHIDKERGIRILFGCALVFGAPAIAAALLGGAGAPAPTPAQTAEPPQLARPGMKPNAFDPYAGASVPVR